MISLRPNLLKPVWSLVSTLVILAAFPPIVSAQVTVNPGESVSLQPTDCASSSGYRNALGISWGDCPGGCAASCDLTARTADAQFEMTNLVGYKYVTSTIYSEFVIADSAATHSSVNATLDYDIAWNGLWNLGGIFTTYNGAKAEVSVYLYDVTGGVSKVVTKTDPPVHTSQPSGFIQFGADGGFGSDSGGTANSMTATLIRGHRYRAALTLHIEAKGLDNATISLDYLTAALGLYWNDFTITVAPDLSEQIDQLATRVSALEDEVDRLRFGLEHHTHTYLPGRGEGHNNTKAQTSEAIIMDDDNIADSTLTWLPEDTTDGEPLPRKSVLLTNYPNPFNPTTTIMYSLPEAARAKIVVYNSLGQVVKTLVNDYVEAGEHTINFDASQLATGVYYYRLTTSHYAETRKLLLMK